MVKIRDLRTQDIDAVLAIADSQLGEKYITEADLSEGKVFVAEEDGLGKIVGFCIALVATKDGKSYVRTVAVAQEFSGQGIGTALVAKAVDYMEGLGAKSILSPLWKHDGVVNSDVIFRRNGFVPVREIPDYWLKDSIEKGYLCPVCGKECHCTCVMYELYLAD
ncbi:MAG: GNAT family N-acetyltransferase [Bacteroidales bacterium]|nr:GNAT family N-acetyltransferase [Bacteroidales bacterium]